MRAANRPVQRPADARLLVIDAHGRVRHASRAALSRILRRGDLIVANDAATLPASLHGVHVRAGEPIEVRLAGRSPRAPTDALQFTAIAFGAGDYRTRTEDRPPPPAFIAGDRLALGSLTAVVIEVLEHPRLLAIAFDASPQEFWRGLAIHGRAIQYAHLIEPLELWDVWTPIAGAPVAFEPPSAGFALDWQLLERLSGAGIELATLTHAAGISSTGDPALDRRLPFDEPYSIHETTALAVAGARHDGRRVIAIGTTVVRALEHAAARFGIVTAGVGMATQRIGRETHLRVVDAVLSGTHEAGSSHYELLRAFTNDSTLATADRELNACGYRTHEFGDSVLVERRASVTSLRDAGPAPASIAPHA